MVDGPKPPRAPRPPGGPGRFARRTDLDQPVYTPPSRLHGDRTRLEQAQSTVHLPQRRGASQPGAAPPSGPPVSGFTAPPPLPPPAAGLESLLSRPTASPLDPMTAGLRIGAGPGPVETAATPSPFDADRIRQLAVSATDTTLPVPIRAFGAFLRMIDDAKRTTLNVIPTLTIADFLEGEEDEGEQTTVRGAFD